MTTAPTDSSQLSTSSAEDPNNDDFFGDQFSAATDTDRREREVEALRHRHMTAGMREGASAAHDAQLQQGFDDGFLEGADASAEAGFLLGCCSMLEAFFSTNGGNLKEDNGVYSVEDSEVPIQDIRDIQREATRLREKLQNLKEGQVIGVESAKEACRKVALIEIPEELSRASARAREKAAPWELGESQGA